MKSKMIAFIVLILYYVSLVFSLRGALYFSFGIDVGNLGPLLFVFFLHMVVSIFIGSVNK